jgi:hypothetical protein
MVAALMGLSMPAALNVSAAQQVAVVQGAHYGSRIFPDNAFSIADSSQVTGRRVNFRVGVDYPTVNGVVQPGCTSADFSICDGFAELNKLDGFDLQPRVTVPFTGAINLASVNDRDVSSTTPIRRRASSRLGSRSRRAATVRRPPQVETARSL